MKKITAIIVEDSRLARNELKDLLKEIPEVEIIAEAENADIAFELINSQSPDLIFLDIQLPGKDGFQLLECWKMFRWSSLQQLSMNLQSNLLNTTH